MGTFEKYPYIDFSNLNLDWILKEVKKRSVDIDLIKKWIEAHEHDYEDLKALYDALRVELDQLEAAISLTVGEWDGEKSYLRYSLVLYEDVQYMAIKDVPAGILITNEEYWQQANNILAQITLMQDDINDIMTDIAFILSTTSIPTYKTVQDMLDNFKASDAVCRVLSAGAIIDGEEVIFNDTEALYRYSGTATRFEYELENGGYALLIPARFTDYHNDADAILPMIMKTAYSYCGHDVRVVTANGPYKPEGQRGGIQCSQFVECLLHGMPYERSKLLDGEYSNMPSMGAFNGFVNSAGVEIYPSASGMAHYAAVKGWFKHTNKLRDVEVGDLLMIKDTELHAEDWHGIGHVVMVIGKLHNAIQVIQAGGFDAPAAGYMSGRFKPGAATDAVNMVYITLLEDTPYVNGTVSIDGIVRVPMTFPKLKPAGTKAFEGFAETAYNAAAQNTFKRLLDANEGIACHFGIAHFAGHTGLNDNNAGCYIGTQSVGSAYGNTLVNNAGSGELNTSGGIGVWMFRVDPTACAATLTMKTNTSTKNSSYMIYPCDFEYYD